MVQLRYKGQNFILVGGYKISTGYTEIKDEDFYRLMNSPTFAHRVELGVFQVPVDFPLKKLDESVSEANEVLKLIISEAEKPTDKDDEDDLETDATYLKKKDALAKIETSSDLEELVKLVSHKSKPVSDAAKAKIDYLKK